MCSKVFRCLATCIPFDTYHISHIPVFTGFTFPRSCLQFALQRDVVFSAPKQVQSYQMQQRCDRLNRPNMLRLEAPFLRDVSFSHRFFFLRTLLAVLLLNRSDVTFEIRLYRFSCLCLLSCFCCLWEGFLFGCPVRGVIEMSLIFWTKSIWDIGTTWFVLHCAKFSIHCAASTSNYVAPETTVVLVTSSLLVCYILSGRKIEYLLERLVERLNFISGEMAELQYKRDLPRLDWSHDILLSTNLCNFSYTRPVCYYVINAWPCFCLYEHVYLISDFLMYSSIVL